MESMINRTYSMSDAVTKPFFAATSVLASYGFHLALSRLSNNKAIIAFAALLCFLFTANTHAQTLEWVKTFGGKYSDYGFFIAIDSEGNVYTTGYFSETVDFDPGTGVTNLSAVGEIDVFIQKLDAQGNFLWAKSFGGKNYAYTASIAIDDVGNVYTIGNFSDTVDFDPGMGVTNLNSVGKTDIFILKLDAQGNFLWAKSFGGTGRGLGTSIAIDAANNVYTTGFFSDTVDFDPGTGVFNLNAIGKIDIFIEKLDAQGNFLWAKSFGGKGQDRGTSISIDAKDNVNLIGVFSDTVDFDPGIGVMNLYAKSTGSCYMQKLDAQGNLLWAKAFKGNDDNFVYTISLDKSGSIYTIGKFSGSVNFNTGTNVTELIAKGARSIFIQKLDEQGNFIWAKSFGEDILIEEFLLSVDAIGNVYITGSFTHTIDFDPGTGVTNLSAVRESDIFILKLDKNGNFLWAKSFGGTSFDSGRSIAIDATGNAYITGVFSDTVDFDPDKDVMKRTAAGGKDIFILKMK